jgi:hypothetical protein
MKRIVTVPLQKLPFNRSDRDYPMKLAMDVAEKKLRPAIRTSWNPALSMLITSCWADNSLLRPSLQRVLASLSMIMTAEGFIVSPSMATTATTNRCRSDGVLSAPGALWRRVETAPNSIMIGEVLGEGAYAVVHKCMFKGGAAALKIFRTTAKDGRTAEESAFKEIEMSFALRHPNIIGLYAWTRVKAKVTQIGMVIELASGGNLRTLYQDSNKFTYGIGLNVALCVAKGLEYMHSMPSPVVHRDIKSMNVMIMADGVTAKIGDCGESRRVVSVSCLFLLILPVLSMWRSGLMRRAHCRI